MVPLLRADGGEEESQVGLVLPEDVRPSEAETMILPRTPDESPESLSTLPEALTVAAS